jgi:hypothetical protein
VLLVVVAMRREMSLELLLARGVAAGGRRPAGEAGVGMGKVERVLDRASVVWSAGS